MPPLNDDFLYGLKRDPDPEFARTLHQRLKATSSARHAPARRWLSAVAVVGVIFAALILASPDVRAQISQQIERLFYGDVELRVLSHDLGPSSSEVSRTAVPNVPIDRLTPAEAQAVIAHKVPTWIPDGFTPVELVSVIHWNENDLGIGYRWLDANGENPIVLSIMNNAMPQLVIGTGANPRDIEINGHKGVIYNGSYDYRAWEPEGYLSIAWVENDVTYLLGSGTLSEADLLRMAESVR